MLLSASKAGSLALLASIAFTSSALPQVAPQTPDSNDRAPPEVVVVTGHRPAPEKIHSVVWKYVYARAGFGPKIGQLTRWIDPVCPVVRNLPPGFDTFIVARIKAIATSVGAPVKETCKPNIEIIFSAQPQVIMDRVAETDPVLLGYHFVRRPLRAFKTRRI